MDQRFPKSYKLCSKKVIGQLFTEGKQLRSFPFVLNHKMVELATQSPFQIVLSVPKRNFKKAHDRNKIKRLMREAVRKNKLILEEPLRMNQKQMALFLIYTHKEEMKHFAIEARVKKIFELLVNSISEENDK